MNVLACASLLSNHAFVENFVFAFVGTLVERLKRLVSLGVLFDIMDQCYSDTMNILIIVADIDVRCAHVQDFLLQVVGQVVHIAQEIDSSHFINNADLLGDFHALLGSLSTDTLCQDQ